MSAHVFLNSSNELGKSDKLPGLLRAMTLLNSIIQEQEC